MGSIAARADKFCGPGKRLGSENDGPGLSWKCIPDASPTGQASGSYGGTSDPASVAAALAARLEMTDNLGPIESDTAGAGTGGRKLNRSAFDAIRSGAYGQAAQQFNIAANFAQAVGNKREAEINRRNAAIAKALEKIRDGASSEARGQAADAARLFQAAAQLISEVNAIQIPSTPLVQPKPMPASVPAPIHPPVVPGSMHRANQSDITGLGGGSGSAPANHDPRPVLAPTPAKAPPPQGLGATRSSAPATAAAASPKANGIFIDDHSTSAKADLSATAKRALELAGSKN